MEGLRAQFRFGNPDCTEGGWGSCCLHTPLPPFHEQIDAASG